MTNRVAWLVAAGTLVAASLPQTGAEEPAGQLEGTWSVVGVTMNGVKATGEIARQLTVTIRGGKMILKPGLSVDGDGKIEPGNAQGDEATIALDPAKSPAQIDLTFGTGKNKLVMKGIYALDKGELKICYSPKARPKDFANVTESGQTLLVAKKDKP